MKCKICGSEKNNIIYHGVIRDGGLGKYTADNVSIYQCNNCSVIWHDNRIENMQQYYESPEYRNILEGGADESLFYTLHDKETLDKLIYTGTDIFRNRVVADIGCGCGAFLDFLKGVAKEIIAVEPSEIYRKIMAEKGFSTYAYTGDAKRNYRNKVDIVTSFDVIEHVERPEEFLGDIFELLREKGKAIIGTPTDAPVMRCLLGEDYEKKLLYSTQHLWIFSEKNLRVLSEKIGFSQTIIKYYQRYGIGNMLGWVKDKAPGTPIEETFVTSTLDSVWKSQCTDQKLSDYIVLKLEK